MINAQQAIFRRLTSAARPRYFRGHMKRFIFPLVALALAAASHAVEPAKLLDKANVLPLAIDDAFQFRKTKTFLNDSKISKSSTDKMIDFERSRINYGA